MGVHEGLPQAPYVQVWGRITGPSFPGLPHENMNLGLAEMQFPAILTGYSSLFLVDILSRSRFFPHSAHPISMQLWANYETHIFKKWGTYPRPPWLRQWLDSRVKQRGPRERYIPRASIWLSTGLIRKSDVSFL